MQKPISFPFSSRHIALLLGFALFAGQLCAQLNIFTETTVNPSQLSPTQTTRYNKIVSSTEYSEVKYVQIGDLATAQLNGRVKVNFSGSSCGEVTFKASNVEYITANDYTWYGEIEPIDTTPCMEGDLLLMSKNGERFGMMRIGSDQYNIEDLTGGIQAVGKVYFDTATPQVCGGTDAGNEGGSVQPRDFNCDIRVLIMYTTSADQQLGNVQTLAQQCIAVTNQAFQNSAVYQQTARLVLAGVEEFSPYSEADETFGDVLSDFETDPMSLARRAATGADLMVLLVNRNIMNHQNVAGLATSVGAGNPNVAFAVVKAFNANDGFVFSHEVAHLIGAHHQLCNAIPVNIQGCIPIPVSGFRHAHSWTQSFLGGLIQVNRNTIMLSQVSPGVVKHYSNPNVKYLGTPTGVANERDNARTIRNNGCTVANYREEFHGTLSVVITGLTKVCEHTEETFLASVSGPPGPYTFQWQVSYNGGFAFQNVGGNTSDVMVTMPNAGSVVVLKLTATSADGQSAIDFHTVQVVPTGDVNCYRSQPSNGESATADSQDALDLAIAPNPSNGVFSLKIFAKNKNEPCVLEAFDNNGLKIKSIFDGQLNSGANQTTFDCLDLPSGIYWLRLLTPSGMVTRKFIIIK